ncbi:Putative germin-like protein 2-1 [Linum grandiflorum]
MASSSSSTSAVVRILLLGLLALSFTPNLTLADPAHLQDFCVADSESSVLVNGVVINGMTCKDPKMVTSDDFYFSGLQMEGNTTTNPQGSRVTPVSVTQLPGLNTLGVSMARIDFAPNGQNPPHTHPRATEILTVIEGCLEVGFVTSNPANAHHNMTLDKGDVFVFPANLVHYQRNLWNTPAVAIAAFSSQSPGVVSVANSVFGSNPAIPADILAKSFSMDVEFVNSLQSNF